MKNKKHIILFCAFLFIMLSLSVVDAAAADTAGAPPGKNVFVLPSSIKNIDESAFEGTSPEYVFLPESVERIGNDAFANIGNDFKLVAPKYSSISENISDDGDCLLLDYSDKYAGKLAGRNELHFDSFILHRTSQSSSEGGSSGNDDTDSLTPVHNKYRQSYKVWRTVMTTIPYEIRNSKTYVQALDFL
ncbi:MAG TPA: hypothetical protein DCG37_08575 [Lachnospiraceae bacterium]|nr:hypothetical protein [Lachnospiraceae bacterium]